MGFVPFTFVDLIDIILVAVIMYWIYRMTKGTNAPYILSGIIAVYLLWVVVRALNMELLSTILGQLISVGAIALIIVFQPELRHKGEQQQHNANAFKQASQSHHDLQHVLGLRISVR